MEHVLRLPSRIDERVFCASEFSMPSPPKPADDFICTKMSAVSLRILVF